MKERYFFSSLLTIVPKQILEKLEIFSVKCAFFTRSQHVRKITKLKNKQNTCKKVQIRIVFSHCLSFQFFKLLLLVHGTTLYVTYLWLKQTRHKSFRVSPEF
jgi:hypothetical protein